MNSYNSLLRNRNSVAHGQGSAVTLEEVKGFYLGAHVVLDYFREALFSGMSSPDEESGSV